MQSAFFIIQLLSLRSETNNMDECTSTAVFPGSVEECGIRYVYFRISGILIPTLAFFLNVYFSKTLTVLKSWSCIGRAMLS